MAGANEYLWHWGQWVALGSLPQWVAVSSLCNMGPKLVSSVGSSHILSSLCIIHSKVTSMALGTFRLLGLKMWVRQNSCFWRTYILVRRLSMKGDLSSVTIRIINVISLPRWSPPNILVSLRFLVVLTLNLPIFSPSSQLYYS